MTLFICSRLNCPLSFVHRRVDGVMDAQGFEKSYTVNSSILLAIQPHLIHFHQLLLQPPKVGDINGDGSQQIPCTALEIPEGKQTKLLIPRKRRRPLLCSLCSCCCWGVTTRLLFASLLTLCVFLEKSHADYAGCAGGTFWEHTPARS